MKAAEAAKAKAEAEKAAMEKAAAAHRWKSNSGNGKHLYTIYT